MAAYEVRNELLVEMLLAVYAVEYGLELVEQLERRLAHEVEHLVTCVLGGNLQSSADMLGDEFARVLHGSLAALLIVALESVENEVVANATAYETLFYTRQSIDSVVDFKQCCVVAVHVRTDCRVDARRALALAADAQILAMHSVHVGRRTAEVGQIAFEVGHLNNLLHLAQDAFLASLDNELALMG